MLGIPSVAHAIEGCLAGAVKSAAARTLTLLACVLLQSCQLAESEEPGNRPASGIQPIASIQEVMQAFIDPSAAAIWESVSTTVTRQGVQETRPRTAQEWQALRLHAIRLSEGANLLHIAGRQVVKDGFTLEDDHVQSNARAEDIATAIARYPSAFSAAAEILQHSAVEALAAVDARDAQRLSLAGAALHSACEGCHLSYWYPNQKSPYWPAATVAAK